MVIQHSRRLALAAALLAPLAGVAQAQQAGVTSAVNPISEGTPPGAPTEVLRLGSNIARNERITTGPDGLTQILFNDGSNLSVGPNADVTINEFVYNPQQGTGRMSMSLARGVLQLAGGRIANTSDVMITSPAGTIGIRGAVGLVSATPGGPTTAAMIYGQNLTVTGQNGGTQSVNQPNFAITIQAPGAPPSPPIYVTAQVLQSFTAALTPKPGSTGGTSAPPTEQSVQESGSGLTKVVVTPVSEGSAFTISVAGNSGLAALLAAISQSASQSNATSQAISLAQAATTPLSALALLNQLIALFGGGTSTNVNFSRIFGVQNSATGTVNGQSVTIATTNGQSFSNLLGQQSGQLNITVAGQTKTFTLATSAPTLRQVDDFPSSQQTLSANLSGTALSLIIFNSYKSIRNTNTASGTINGIPYTITVPQGSVIGRTPQSTPVTFALNGQVIYSGSLLKLNTGFKP